MGQLFPATSSSSIISTLQSNFKLRVSSLEETRIPSGFGTISRPRIGVELIVGEETLLN
jgi:hypothetical protein